MNIAKHHGAFKSEQETSMDIQLRKNSRRRIHGKRNIEKHHEIWFEIFTRLPIKTLFAAQGVCKSWWLMIFLLQQRSKSRSLPLCGFILKSSLGGSNLTHVPMIFINLVNKEATLMRSSDSGSHIVDIASNANDDYRLLADLSLDFGCLFGKTRSSAPFKFSSSIGIEGSFNFNGLCVDRKSQSCFFAIHRGLILVVYDDGNYLVHNPVTMEFTRLPKPPSLNRCLSKCISIEKTGFIMRNTLSYSWVYHVVRVCRISKVIEVYKSYGRPLRWKVSKLGLDEELVQACWCWENIVILAEVHTCFLLTNKDRGVAIRTPTPTRSKAGAYGFGLPHLVQEGFQNARLGECRGCLHISYYNASGVWIWKHVDKGKTVTPEAWVPLFEISYYRQLCKPLAMEYLGNVLNSGNLVVPLAFHPDAPIVLFRVKSWIVAYDNDKDTFDEISELEDQGSTSVTVFPYSPCLVSPVGKRIGPFFKYSQDDPNNEKIPEKLIDTRHKFNISDKFYENRQHLIDEVKPTGLLHNMDIRVFPYPNEIPDFMIPWIIDWVDVHGDGNCGYRAVAQEIYGDQEKWLTVRRDMLNELIKNRLIYIQLYGSEIKVDKLIKRVSWWTGEAPRTHWMNTGMGFIIANCYDAIFTFLSSTHQSLTILPVTPRSSISECSKQIISIALLDSYKHFTWVRFGHASSLPVMHPMWRHYADKSRAPEFKQIKRRITSYKCLITLPQFEAASPPTEVSLLQKSS